MVVVASDGTHLKQYSKEFPNNRFCHHLPTHTPSLTPTLSPLVLYTHIPHLIERTYLIFSETPIFHSNEQRENLSTLFLFPPFSSITKSKKHPKDPLQIFQIGPKSQKINSNRDKRKERRRNHKHRATMASTENQITKPRGTSPLSISFYLHFCVNMHLNLFAIFSLQISTN